MDRLDSASLSILRLSLFPGLSWLRQWLRQAVLLYTKRSKYYRSVTFYTQLIHKFLMISILAIIPNSILYQSTTLFRMSLTILWFYGIMVSYFNHI